MKPLAPHPTIDELTGLPFRPSYLELLERSAADAMARAAPLSLLLVDIDRFKSVNDAHGQDVGDAVLRALGPLLGTHAFRRTGVVGRMGGDEFMIHLLHMPFDEACTEAENLRHVVERHPFPVIGATATVSIGVATSPEGRAWTVAQLVSMADQRRVVAKKRLHDNRNRVWAGRLPDDWTPAAGLETGWPTLATQPDF